MGPPGLIDEPSAESLDDPSSSDPRPASLVPATASIDDARAASEGDATATTGATKRETSTTEATPAEAPTSEPTAPEADSDPPKTESASADDRQTSEPARAVVLPPDSSTGRAGTVRMSVSDLAPKTRAKVASKLPSIPASPIGRLGSRPSTEIGRPSRLSSIRTSMISMRKTLMSVLPAIPISKLSRVGPIGALSMLLTAIIAIVLWLGTTGRLPPSVARALRFDAPTEKRVAPPSDVRAEEDDSLIPSLSRVKPGRGSAAGGVLDVPPSFVPRANGAFDLVIHFHGNTDLALESYESVGLDAVFLVFNLGNGSGKYEERFLNPSKLDEVLARVVTKMGERGLPHPRVRRLALVGWSAGYGAVIRILADQRQADRVDAVILLDGLHASFREGTTIVAEDNLRGIIQFAERAKKNEKLLVLTHSNIDPVEYLGVHATVDHVLSRVGVTRHDVGGATQMPTLAAMQGVLPKDEMKPLEPRTVADEGDLIVRGYGGNEARHHIGHLVQMSTIALPSLVRRWK